MRTLWCRHIMRKRAGSIRFNAICERPLSLCFLLLNFAIFAATKLRWFESDRQQGLFLFAFYFFFTTHGYNELYYVRHKLETIKD